jgi:hypothetical protein
MFESSMMAVAALTWIFCGCSMKNGDDWLLKVFSISLGGFCTLFADVIFLVPRGKLIVRRESMQMRRRECDIFTNCNGYPSL